MSHTSRPDLHAQITNTIIDAIEAGTGTFIMPWHGAWVGGLPKNALTNNHYHGINLLVLMVRAKRAKFYEPLWATYKQWQQMDKQVAKGQRGTQSILYKPALDKDDGAQILDDNGRPRVYIRASYLFNIGQIEGYVSAEERDMLTESRIVLQDRAETLIASTGADIRIGGSEAFYHFEKDYIGMPDRERFNERDGNDASASWYASLFHEIVHWSGASHRLGRKKNDPSSDAYAFEELVADLGSAFLMAELGIPNQPLDAYAGYLSNWLKAFKNDKTFIFKAAAQAGKATRYLLDMMTDADTDTKIEVAIKHVA